MLSRRNMLKAGLAGMAGLSLPALAAQPGRGGGRRAATSGAKSVILLWMAGGPSHIDTWDPKPDRPLQNRGPFGVIATRLPGVLHLRAPAEAGGDARPVHDHPLGRRPAQQPRAEQGLPDRQPRGGAAHQSAAAELYPGHRLGRRQASTAPNHPAMPPYVAFMKSRSHLAFGGYLGQQYDPFIANQAARLPIYTNVGVDTGRTTEADFFRLPAGLTHERIHERRDAAAATSTGCAASSTAPARWRRWTATASRRSRCCVGRRAQDAFDLAREPAAVRDRYGKHLWCQQALLARRLVEAGVAFVTLDLSYHTASGTWDTHGDNIPPYGGISKGLRPLLPLFDHLITTLVGDLEQRGLLDDVLVIAMGEFGRTPHDGHAGQHRRPQPLAGGDVDGAGRRRLAARAGDRRHRSGRRPHQGAAASRPATWRRRSTTTWACRSTPTYLGHDRPAALHRREWAADSGVAVEARDAATDHRAYAFG